MNIKPRGRREKSREKAEREKPKTNNPASKIFLFILTYLMTIEQTVPG
jgi:hypothetical protein